LRRALKFKVSVFLLAWFIFFAHNVIPHNHAYENFEACRHLVHDTFSCTSEEDRSAKASNENSHEEVCHLSNILFHNLSPEVFLSHSCRDIHFNPESAVAEVFIDSDNLFNSDHLKGTFFLRAPPMV